MTAGLVSASCLAVTGSIVVRAATVGSAGLFPGRSFPVGVMPGGVLRVGLLRVRVLSIGLLPVGVLLTATSCCFHGSLRWIIFFSCCFFCCFGDPYVKCNVATGCRVTVESIFWADAGACCADAMVFTGVTGCGRGESIQ